eukprot:448999_1
MSQLITQRSTSMININDKFKTDIKNTLLYSFGVRFFYWDYYKDNKDVYDIRQNYGFDDKMRHANEGDYTLQDWYFAKKYKSLKEEILQNEIFPLLKYKWLQLYQLANIHLNCTQGKSFRNIIPMFAEDNNADMYGIKPGDTISIEHVIAIMIYCNYDALQAKFSSTFRRIPYDESDKHLKSRHANFVNLARLLRELECFGCHDAKNIQSLGTLYHGVSVDVSFQTVRAHINGPFSTTSDYYVALNFSQKQGVILELTVEGGWKSRVLAPGFECFWISNYINEQEVFFLGAQRSFSFVNITEVSSGMVFNYQLYVNGLRRMLNTMTMEKGWTGNNSIMQNISSNRYQNVNIKSDKQMAFRLLAHQVWKL